MANFGFQLDAVTGDLSLPLKEVTDPLGSIAQAVRIRLQFFLGEWFLDLSVGVPYFEQILIKNPDVRNVQGLIRKEILATPGVLSLLALKLVYDSAGRELTVTYTANTDFGPLNRTEVF
jgi:hypothetical protein